MNDTQMTIVYFKRTGNIVRISSGVHDLSIFGEQAQDYKLIWDCVTLPYDEFVISHPYLFKIDIENKQLKLLDNSVSKYI